MGSQVYQSTSFKMGSEVVTIVIVSYSAVATNEMAVRSMAAMMPLFKNSTLVLAAQVGLAPEFIGPKHVVDFLKGKTFADFRWTPITVTN